MRDATTAGVTIRPAFPRHASPLDASWRDDGPALARLAALDSQRLPAGPLLLAEIDGEPWAAIALETGRIFADPFRPTAALVDLLRRRAAQLSAAREEATRPARRAPGLSSRAARPAPRRAPAR